MTFPHVGQDYKTHSLAKELKNIIFLMKNDLVISVSICLLVKKKSIFQTFAQCLIWPPCIFRSAFRREESCSGRRPLGGSGRGTVLHQLFLGPHRTATEARRQAGLNTLTETRGVLQVCTLTGKTRMWRGMITRKKKSDRPAEPGVMFLFPHHCMKNAPVNLKTTAPGMPPSKRLNAT